MPETQMKILQTLDRLENHVKQLDSRLMEMNTFLDTVNCFQAKTDVKVTEIKLFLMNNGE